MAQSTSTTQSAQSVADTKPADTKSSSTASSPSYTVSISNAGRAAMLEASETSVQTAQEAGRGDLQAQRLLSREQAAKAQ
jgi:hypothetical protein